MTASKDVSDTTTIADIESIRSKLLEISDPSEVDVYLLLLENGAKRIAEIADYEHFDRRAARHLVSALLDKGLVVATFKHPIQFTAVPIDKVLRILSKSKGKYYAKIC
jgi:predicted transcriptional regulator